MANEQPGAELHLPFSDDRQKNKSSHSPHITNQTTSFTARTKLCGFQISELLRSATRMHQKQ